MGVTLIAPLIALPDVIYDGVRILVLHLERSDQGILRLDVHGSRATGEVHANCKILLRHLRLGDIHTSAFDAWPCTSRLRATGFTQIPPLGRRVIDGNGTTSRSRNR